ncbi:outer membrane beta-barrel protein [Methylocystis parvus]|uniref:outer membrane beta-barrel protein n=1 Tax=Methylocystis parvus TaxID=134 RepID=UPI003C769C57
MTWQKNIARPNGLKGGACILAACAAGVGFPASLAQAQAFNPTVLAPAAKLPQQRDVAVSVARGRRGLEAPAGAEKKYVTVRSVTIAGAFPELAEQNATLAQKLQGKRLSLAEIYLAVGELQAAYAKAYPLALITAPRPDFANGDVRLSVSDGFIEKLEISGVAENTQELVRERLQPLVGQRHLTAAEFQRRTMLVGTLSGVSGQAATNAGSSQDGWVLALGVVENRVASSTAVTNRLPKQFGTWEFAHSFALNNALGYGEQFAGAVSSSPDFDRYFDGTAKSQAYSMDVAVPIGADGLMAGVGYLNAHSRATPLFSATSPDLLNAGERVTGRFQRAYARIAYPVFLTNDLTLRTQAAYEYITNRNSFLPYPVLFADPLLQGAIYGNDISRDRYSVIRLSSDAKYKLPWLENTTFSGLVLYSNGLGGRADSIDQIFGPPLSRVGASPTFHRLNLKARLDIGLPEEFIFSAIGRYQTSFGQPLMLPENFLLDGSEAVSGFASGTLNVDRGVTARGELMRPVTLEILDYNHLIAPYIFGAWGSGVHENVPVGFHRQLWASTFGGGVRTDTNFTGSPWGESLALEFGRDFSNIPFRESGYRTNVAFNMRYAGNPLAPDAAPASVTGVLKKGPPPSAAPALWQGAYAGLNAGYTWDPRPEIATAGVPVATGIDDFLTLNGALSLYPPFWLASAAGMSGRSMAAGGGSTGGAQIGYNFQADRFVAGFEADLQGSNARTRHGLFNGTDAWDGFTEHVVITTVNHTKNVDWLGTARGRLGYLISPTLLGYGTAGFAYGETRASTFIRQNWGDAGFGFALQASNSTGSYSGFRTGWTIGGGLEWMFAPNASVKAEYLHYDLGSASYALTPLATLLAGGALSNVLAPSARTQFRGDIARVGLNYHFGQSGFETASLVQPSAFGSGFYAGLNAGYGWDTASSVSTVATPAQTGLDGELRGTIGLATAVSATGVAHAPANGAFGGGQAGYNYLVDNYVAGVEADLQGAAMSGRGGYAGAATGAIAGVPLTNMAASAQIEKTLDWFGTLRARGGYLLTPSILLYGTGGFAYGGATIQNQVASLTDGGGIGLRSMSSISALSTARVGWTVGGGVEWKFTPAMSLKAEYLHYDLGHVQFGSGALATSLVTNVPNLAAFTNTTLLNSATRLSGEMARLGVNYHFAPAAALPLLGH